MGNDDIFHAGGIEAELLQAADNDRLGLILIGRVDQDDSVAGGQRPGRTILGADEIHVVEDLGRLGVPARPVGRRRRGGVASCVAVLRGATQSAPSKPRNSNPPAFLAAARWASIEFGAGCAPAGAAPKTAMTASAKMTRCFIANSRYRCRRAAGLPTEMSTAEGYTACRPGGRVAPCALSQRGRPSLVPRLPSLPGLLEISQVRRRLVFLGGHEQAVAAQEKALVVDFDVAVALGTNLLDPFRLLDRHAGIGLGDRPRPGQRVVDGRDLVVEDVRIGLVGVDPLLEDALIVEGQRNARGVVGPRALSVRASRSPARRSGRRRRYRSSGRSNNRRRSARCSSASRAHR